MIRSGRRKEKEGTRHRRGEGKYIGNKRWVEWEEAEAARGGTHCGGLPRRHGVDRKNRATETAGLNGRSRRASWEVVRRRYADVAQSLRYAQMGCGLQRETMRAGGGARL
jgi:hypothetical protein